MADTATTKTENELKENEFKTNKNQTIRKKKRPLRIDRKDFFLTASFKMFRYALLVGIVVAVHILLLNPFAMSLMWLLLLAGVSTLLVAVGFSFSLGLLISSFFERKLLKAMPKWLVGNLILLCMIGATAAFLLVQPTSLSLTVFIAPLLGSISLPILTLGVLLLLNIAFFCLLFPKRGRWMESAGNFMSLALGIMALSCLAGIITSLVLPAGFAIAGFTINSLLFLFVATLVFTASFSCLFFGYHIMKKGGARPIVGGIMLSMLGSAAPAYIGALALQSLPLVSVLPVWATFVIALLVIIIGRWVYGALTAPSRRKVTGGNETTTTATVTATDRTNEIIDVESPKICSALINLKDKVNEAYQNENKNESDADLSTQR